MRVSRKRRRNEFLIGAGIFIVLAIVYAAVLGIYQSENENRQNLVQISHAKNPAHMNAKATIRSVDPAKEEATIRIEFDPQGGFRAEDGFASAYDVRVLVNANSGKQEYEFLKDKRINPIEFTVNTSGGNVSEYPFDKYSTPVEMIVTASKKDLEEAEASNGDEESPAPPTQSPAADGTTSVTQVPVESNLYFDGTLAGWSVSAEAERVAIPGYVAFSADMKRASTAIYFACFINAAIVVIAIGVLLIALSVAVRGRQVELPMITLGVIVLFALPALRNFLPGQPPIGTLLDFVAFFWAQAIVAISVVILTFCFLSRENGYPRSWGGKPYPPDDDADTEPARHLSENAESPG